MPESVNCRGCGRRVVLPASIDRQRARCPKCRTKLAAPAVAPDPNASAAYQEFLTQSLEFRSVQAPPQPAKPAETPLDLPEEEKEEVLSLDDAPAADPRPPLPSLPKNLDEPSDFFPPPFRFTVRVLADSARQFQGAFFGVLTPYGLFLELSLNQPVSFIPVGASAQPEGAVLTVKLPDRSLTLQFGGIPQPEQLAEDTAAFLSGLRPVPLPSEYRRPWWLAGIGALLTIGLAVGPIVMAESAEIEFWIGLLCAFVFTLLAASGNAAIALYSPMATGAKIAVMAVSSSVLLGIFLVLAMVFLVPEASPPSIPPTSPPLEIAPGETPPSIGSGGAAPSEPRGPPSHLDLIYRDGQTRLDDGPADVTALAVSPLDGSAIIGYADGSTRIWASINRRLNRRDWGRGPSAIRRIDFDSAGKFAMLSCDAGLVVFSLAALPRSPVMIPGAEVAVSLEPGREKLAAIRNGRVQVRLLPMSLVKSPPEATASLKGFVTTSIKDETLPAGIPAAGIPPPNGGKATFLAWHPTGRLLCGGMDGSIATIASGQPALPPFTSREHKSPVRTWAATPWGDFATGDDDGYIGYWPNKAKTILKFKAGGLAIKGLAFNPCGGELAVVDTSGWVSVWYPEIGKKAYEAIQKSPAKAAAYGPQEDILMISDGKGVNLWWIPELIEQGAKK